MSQNTHIINVRTKGANKSKKEIKGVSGALGGLAKQAGIAAAAYFGVRGLINGINGSIDAFGKQELAEKKLEAAIGKTSQLLLGHAKAIQQVTMFGDEQVIEAQALIGSFVKEEEAIMAATEATLDLAAAKGFDLTAAADLVSKTLGSSTNALTRYGIEVKGAVGSTERLNSLTTNIAAVFGGQATQQAQTLAGAMQQMKNAMGDTAEAIGSVLAPVASNVAGIFKTAAESVGEFFTKASETRLETTIREMRELGVSGNALIKLQELQLSKEIEELNKELKTQNKQNLEALDIETKLKAIAKEKKSLTEDIIKFEEQDQELKEQTFIDEMGRLRTRKSYGFES